MLIVEVRCLQIIQRQFQFSLYTSPASHFMPLRLALRGYLVALLPRRFALRARMHGAQESLTSMMYATICLKCTVHGHTLCMIHVWKRYPCMCTKPMKTPLIDAWKKALAPSIMMKFLLSWLHQWFRSYFDQWPWVKGWGYCDQKCTLEFRDRKYQKIKFKRFWN